MIEWIFNWCTHTFRMRNPTKNVQTLSVCDVRRSSGAILPYCVAKMYSFLLSTTSMCNVHTWIISTIEHTHWYHYLYTGNCTYTKKRWWRWKWVGRSTNSTEEKGERIKQASTDKWIVRVALCKHKNLNKRKICTELVIWLIVSSLHFSAINTECECVLYS